MEKGKREYVRGKDDKLRGGRNLRVKRMYDAEEKEGRRNGRGKGRNGMQKERRRLRKRGRRGREGWRRVEGVGREKKERKREGYGIHLRVI